MSFGLYWRPTPKEIPPAHDLPVALKYVIARRLWDHDGSLRGEAILGARYINYLAGVRDAGTGEVEQGAQELLDAIREHGEIEVWIGDPGDH